MASLHCKADCINVQGSNNAIQAAGQHGNGYSQAQPQASSSMQDSHTQQQQPSRSAWDDYPQSSSNVSQQNHAQQSGRDNSFGNASGYGTPQDAHTGYKDASAATRQSARDDAERERRAEQERQRQYDIQTAAEYSRQRQQPEDGVICFQMHVVCTVHGSHGRMLSTQREGHLSMPGKLSGLHANMGCRRQRMHHWNVQLGLSGSTHN